MSNWPGSTRRACPDPQMQAERRYFGALETVRQFGFVMGRLARTYSDALLLDVNDPVHPGIVSSGELT